MIYAGETKKVAGWKKILCKKKHLISILTLSGVLRVIRPKTGEEPEALRHPRRRFLMKSSPPGSDEPVGPRRWGNPRL
jgi:hypothetical protein